MLNGCHNRKELQETLIVRDGWYGTGIKIPRTIKWLEIPYQMSKDCEYQKLKKDDPKCLGCKHKVEK